MLLVAALGFNPVAHFLNLCDLIGCERNRIDGFVNHLEKLCTQRCVAGDDAGFN